MTPHDLRVQYRRLLRQFGPQGWWPLYEFEISDFKLQMTRKQCPKRLTEAERFQICVGAILTQNTAWTNVEKVFERFHQFSPPPAGSGSPIASGRGSERGIVRSTSGSVMGWENASWSPDMIVSLHGDHLARLIRPAGYFNQKAEKLQAFSRWLLDRYGGSLRRFFRQPTDRCRAELLSLWGIGPETADSMLLYAGRHPAFVIDAYTKRWLEKQKLSNTKCSTYDDYQRFFMDRLPHDAALFNEFHALIVACGKANRRRGVH